MGAKAKAKAEAKADDKKAKKEEEEEDEPDSPKSGAGGGGSTTLPAVKASPKPKKGFGKPGSPGLGMPVRSVMSTEIEESPERAKGTAWKRFNPTRSLPDLACTFGCAPGTKRGGPNELALSDSWPIIRRAMDHLEKNSVLVERIGKDDIAWAMMQTRTKSYRESEEGKRAEGLHISMPQDGDKEEANAGVSGKGKEVKKEVRKKR